MYDRYSLTLSVYKRLNYILSHLLHSVCHFKYSSDHLTVQGKRTQSRLLHYHHKVLLTTGHKTQVTYNVYLEHTVDSRGHNKGQNTKQTIYKSPLLHTTEDIKHVQEGTELEQKCRIHSGEKTQ